MAFVVRSENTGYIKEKEFGLEYTYKTTRDSWALSMGYTHEIDCSFGCIRFARIKKTVAYICIDENKEEKWHIKRVICNFLTD
jgi:hypothetical protein